MRHWNGKGCWDYVFGTFTSHACLCPLLGQWVLQLYIVVMFRSCTHVSMVVVVAYWNNKENRNVGTHAGATVGVLVQDSGSDPPVPLPLRRVGGSTQCTRGLSLWPTSHSCCARSMCAYKPSVAVLCYPVVVASCMMELQVSTRC